MSQFVHAKKIRLHYDVSAQTLRNWARRGRINYKTIQIGTRKTWLYELSSVGRIIQGEHNSSKDIYKRVLYTRVSSQKQKADLERQNEFLQKAYPDSEIISDIGSGLNDSRRGFCSLVEQVCKGEIQEIVVTYKDRLTRFGFDMFNQVCREHGCKIVVWSQDNHLEDVEVSETRELQEDLLSVINFFVARRNGKRAGALRRERKKAENNKKEITK